MVSRADGYTLSLASSWPIGGSNRGARVSFVIFPGPELLSLDPNSPRGLVALGRDVRVRHDIAQARFGLAEVIVAVVDEDLLARGDVATGSECDAPAAAVRDKLDVQVRLTAVVDEARDLCQYNQNLPSVFFESVLGPLQSLQNSIKGASRKWKETCEPTLPYSRASTVAMSSSSKAYKYPPSSLRGLSGG